MNLAFWSRDDVSKKIVGVTRLVKIRNDNIRQTLGLKHKLIGLIDRQKINKVVWPHTKDDKSQIPKDTPGCIHGQKEDHLKQENIL